MKRLFLFMVLLATFLLRAQRPQNPRPIKITGTVIDTDSGKPLEFATLVLQDVRNPENVTGGITDENGTFEVSTPPGMFNISIEYISYVTFKQERQLFRSNTNLGTISLSPDINQLQEVDVVAERTTVELRLDKKIYNVGKDLTVQGATVSDVLDNVPSVSVDVEGNVQLRGNDDVRILINGKPSAITGLNSTEALRQLPAESIEKVEVITSPSARYDAEGSGGIINIILRRSKLQGLNGAVTLNGGYPLSAGINGNINYRTGDLNFFTNTGYNYRTRPGNSLNDNDFFDANGDGVADLYVVSAGNEYDNGQVFTYDRLYINDGRGNLRFAPRALPQIGTHGKKITAADIDRDGDMDLFVAANIVKGAYGLNPRHQLLINNGRGQFSDGTTQLMPEADALGMLNDAVWLDYDADGDQDLLAAGEWTALTLLENDGKGRLTRVEPKGFEDTEGMWMSLATTDLDGDGDLDIVAGNYGLNTKLKASVEKPLSLFVNDFDGNGQADPVIFHYVQEAQIPFATRDDLIKQMAFIKKKHPDYASYAKVSSPKDLFESEKLKSALTRQVHELSSVVMINNGGSFQKLQLPNEAQLSPVMDILTSDVNGDGIMDLLLAGNFFGFRNDIGQASAQPLTLLLGNGNGEFRLSNQAELNNQVTRGEYRKSGQMNLNKFLLLRNNDFPLILSFSK